MGRRKSKETEEEDAGGEQAHGSEPFPSISKTKLKKLADQRVQAAQDVREINGAIGQQIKDAIQNEHLHRQAFNAASKHLRKTAEEIAEFRYFYNRYCDELGVTAKADGVNFLDFGSDSAESRSNVSQFPAPESVAAE